MTLKGEDMMSAQMNATILINHKPVLVEWTHSAVRELAKRSQPLVVELELYFFLHGEKNCSLS